MRGKELNKRTNQYEPGITPAYAGKSFRMNFPSHESRDHPRLCGEKVVAVALCVRDRGSPPPMRGKALLQGIGVGGSRITPAYAGKSKKREPDRHL